MDGTSAPAALCRCRAPVGREVRRIGTGTGIDAGIGTGISDDDGEKKRVGCISQEEKPEEKEEDPETHPTAIELETESS